MKATKLFAVTCVALAAFAPSLFSQQVLFSMSDFTGTPIDPGSFVEGTTALNTLFRGGGGFTAVAEGGNPGSFMGTTTYNNALWFAIAAPTGADTYTFSFDYILQGTIDSETSRNFSVYGVDAGQTVKRLGNAQVVPTPNPDALIADVLYTQVLDTTETWANIAVDVPVPAGYAAVLFRLNKDAGNPLTGIDNIQVTSAIPEPSHYAAMLAAAALAFVYVRRRK